MNEQRYKSPDIISFVATIVSPIWVIARLITGSWVTNTFYLLVLAAVAVFYWFFVLRNETALDEGIESDDVCPPMIERELQSKNTSPIVMTAVAGAYILFLVLCAFASHMTTK